MKEKFKVLYEPIKIGKLEIKNRFVMAPMGPLASLMMMAPLMNVALSIMWKEQKVEQV